MDLSQHKKAEKTAENLMRMSARHTGTIDELALIETAQFLIRQTDQIIELQNELERLKNENVRRNTTKTPRWQSRKT